MNYVHVGCYGLGRRDASGVFHRVALCGAQVPEAELRMIPYADVDDPDVCPDCRHEWRRPISNEERQGLVDEQRRERLAAVQAEIDTISRVLEDRMKELDPATPNAEWSPIRFATPAERERLHELKLMLPTYAERRLAARERLAARVIARKSNAADQGESRGEKS